MSIGAKEGTGHSRVAMVLIVSLFFLWGMANNLNDVLIPHFRKAFTLSDFASGLVQSAFYMGYFLVAIPAALFMQRFGYKSAVIFGLILYGLGALLFVPAAWAERYEFFLGALFVIAGGLAFLETSANPMVATLGAPEDAERRLNFAQAFNPLGSITGVVIGGSSILSGIERTPEEVAAMSPAAQAAWRSQELSFVQSPYVVIGVGVLLWALLIAVNRFPASATRGGGAEGIGSLAGFGALFRRGRYMFGVFAQFCYVGAQVGLWSYTIRYAQAEVGATEGFATNLLIVSLVLFMIGRFAGAALMRKVPPMTLLASFGAVNLLLCLVAAFVGGDVGMVALVATSFFMSIMFPTIFAASLRGLGELTKLGSSLVVMAIIGGAVLTAVMGAISDASGMIQVAMLVPAGCFVVVALFARRMGRSEG